MQILCNLLGGGGRSSKDYIELQGGEGEVAQCWEQQGVGELHGYG